MKSIRLRASINQLNAYASIGFCGTPLKADTAIQSIMCDHYYSDWITCLQCNRFPATAVHSSNYGGIARLCRSFPQSSLLVPTMRAGDLVNTSFESCWLCDSITGARGWVEFDETASKPLARHLCYNSSSIPQSGKSRLRWCCRGNNQFIVTQNASQTKQKAQDASSRHYRQAAAPLTTATMKLIYISQCTNRSALGMFIFVLT